MPQCPQCNKPLVELTRQCPSCRADLDLLVDYVATLQTGLERAESLTHSGELGKAFWAYLEVLEADPDNLAARRQIEQVVTAVRQFDKSAPGRRWLSGADNERILPPWLIASVFAGLLILVVVLAFSLGYLLGFYAPTETNKPDNPPAEKKGPDRFPPLLEPKKPGLMG